jgi:hypothetical protein
MEKLIPGLNVKYKLKIGSTSKGVWASKDLRAPYLLSQSKKKTTNGTKYIISNPA